MAQRALGEQRATEISQAVALGVATSMQRRWYLPPMTERSWDRFHRDHERQMREGLVRHNEHAVSASRSGEKVEFQITRCGFHEALRELGTPALTEAFCHSDEIVFNEYLPSMRFHRGGGGSNTIATCARAQIRLRGRRAGGRSRVEVSVVHEITTEAAGRRALVVSRAGAASRIEKALGQGEAAVR